MWFSGLRERLDADDPDGLDNSLDKLATRTVRRTDEGYELGESGKRIVRQLPSGAAIDDPGSSQWRRTCPADTVEKRPSSATATAVATSLVPAVTPGASRVSRRA